MVREISDAESAFLSNPGTLYIYSYAGELEHERQTASLHTSQISNSEVRQPRLARLPYRKIGWKLALFGCD